ncbi:GAF and ANTAR domain-containing protein [Mycobacterium asiaticum]|uniref:GAF and ANTAR domain-containing protein n=1 Tax=Mycobacterium asiaticum TaxID=1790 RepID=UPI0007EFE0BD|nr:GAF and ANTAR domain-containing protein [Mycobacterium asiaticum]OBJ65682.1 antitermination regulator [Mycobacterium asiaticum]
MTAENARQPCDSTATGGNLAGLSGVLEAIHSAKPADLPKALNQLTIAAATSVPGAQYAGITVTSRQNHVGTPSVSHRYPELLDEIQKRHLQGPCLQAAWNRETVIVEDLETDDRWPRYRDEALAQTPIRSVVSLPMFADKLLMGALNIFAEASHVFDEKSLDAARTFAMLGALAWSNVVRKQQFDSALSSRDVIGQAKGILMERYGVDDEAAFAMLVKISQDSQLRLREVGRRLAESENPSDD